MIIAESAYLIDCELGTHVERLMYDSSIVAGNIIVDHHTLDDWTRSAELVIRFESLPLG